MRNNQPVTNEEYIVPAGMTLVSKTDLVGNIIECNDAFEAASGFSRDQLIGQPHNLVRHPDVPETVFADLWGSLKAGKTWSQVVKNRRKDGGYYWVRANATPLYTDGKISGYMSIRTPVTEAEKTATDQAYKDIKAGKLKIKDGRVYKGADLNLIGRLQRMSPAIQLPLVVFLTFFIPFIGLEIAEHTFGIPINMLLEGFIAISAAILFTALYGIRLTRQNQIIATQLKRIASGDELPYEWSDQNTNFGKRKDIVRAVYLAARERVEESAYQLDQSQQLQSAIDQISSNLMIADGNLQIKYMNQEMVSFLRKKEATLQNFLPHFKVDDLMGQNIDIFHKDPSHQRGLLNKLTEPYLGKISLGDTHLEVYVIPVFNRAGARTATIAEWRDKTAEVQLLEEVNGAVGAAQKGVLNTRIDLSRVDGVARELSKSINDLISTVEKPVNQAIKVAVALSEGDLTKELLGEYQGRFAVLQDSMNVAVDSLASMMAQTKGAVQSVSGGADQIYQGSIDLNDRTQQQAASLEETASSMEEMTAAVKHNAENAREASSVTQTTAEQARSGVSVMQNAISSMEQINESSQKINDIIGLIDSIAFQTNLLALNAAVEAARAGEHGRGFAVVAGEVRNLAGKSSEAAKDIRDLIEDTVKKVSEGTHHVKGSGDALNEIVESITNVNQIIEEIATSSNEQSEGVSLVNTSITNIDTAVQQNAALVEESAATAEELGEMAKIMSRNVNQFIISNSVLQAAALNVGGFDFSAAKREQAKWKVKLRACINDVDIDFDRSAAIDSTKGVLGSWINGEGRNYNSLPSFQALSSQQAALHNAIKEVIELKDNGEVDAANEKMNLLTNQIDSVTNAISAMESDISHGGGMPAPAAKPVAHKAAAKPAAKTATAKPVAKPVSKTAAASKPSAAPSKPAGEAGLQTPAPAQPRNTGNEDEWAEF